MWTVIVVTFHVLGLLSAIDAVMSTRTSQGAIAWGVSLIAFPYVAVPAYWILGRSRFKGYVTARQTGDATLHDFAVEVGKGAQAYVLPETDLQDIEAGRAAQSLAGMPFLTGNSASC